MHKILQIYCHWCWREIRDQIQMDKKTKILPTQGGCFVSDSVAFWAVHN